jgi:hypothetical protein
VPKKRPPPAEEPPLRVHAIRPTGVYSLHEATRALGMAASTLEREIHLRRIKCARRGGKVLFLGSWLIRWVEEGAEAAGQACACTDRPALSDMRHGPAV